MNDEILSLKIDEFSEQLAVQSLPSYVLKIKILYPLELKIGKRSKFRKYYIG
jgi:hypothetical protein